MQITLRRGRDIAMPGAPEQVVRSGPQTDLVALLGSDVPEVPPDFRVTEGEAVAAGQVLFVDRKRPEIAFTSPISGKIHTLRRGRRRMLDALVIERDGDRQIDFKRPDSKDSDGIRSLLLDAGLWSAFRSRPFERIPDPSQEPAAIFVTAIDTAPLAADPVAIAGRKFDAFEAGLSALQHLTEGTVFVCHGEGFPDIEARDRQQAVQFSGPHPAGLPGTHIHALMPASRNRNIWHIGYQDVIEIGSLVTTGRRDASRIVALAGPGVRSPGLAETVLGADLEALLEGSYADHASAPVSGSILSGRVSRYLGRYHTQVTVPLRDGSAAATPVGGILARLFSGSGAIIPVAVYDGVMPLNLLTVPLLRAIATGDAESAERLGCLELAEEDMALLTHVCPSGHDYGVLLRGVLDEIAEQM